MPWRHPITRSQHSRQLTKIQLPSFYHKFNLVVNILRTRCWSPGRACRVAETSDGSRAETRVWICPFCSCCKLLGCSRMDELPRCYSSQEVRTSPRSLWQSLHCKADLFKLMLLPYFCFVSGTMFLHQHCIRTRQDQGLCSITVFRGSSKMLSSPSPLSTCS